MANVLGELFQNIADAIRSKTGSTDKLKPNQFPEAIEGITAGGGGSSGDNRVKYVTFMYGETELIKYPVISGDTCRDPVANGFISTPTKESTAQYTYEYSGWSLTDGNSSSSSALTNVTEDRTVYAAFKATVRTYTITYYDSDGTTVLKTESLAYGTVPSYMPGKEGYSFDSWTPVPVAVTGDASYTASWAEQITFAKGSWADIVAIVEAGEAQNYFSLGDTRNFNVDGYTIPFMIVGFNHDDLANGSGKAGLSLLSTQLYPVLFTRSEDANAKLTMSFVGRSAFDTEVNAAIKLVKKNYASSYLSNAKVKSGNFSGWMPSAEEMGTNLYSTNLSLSIGKKYDYFTLNSGDMRRYIAGTTNYGTYFIRDVRAVGVFNTLAQIPSNSQKFSYTTDKDTKRYSLIGICI